MPRNAHLHIVVTSEFLESLKKQANIRDLSVSELCRQKLYDNLQMDRIELMIERLLNKNERQNRS